MNFLEAIYLVGVRIIAASSRVTLNLFCNMIGLLEAICAAIVVSVAAVVVRIYQVLVLRWNSHCGA